MAVMAGLYVRGDDDGLWYPVGMYFDSVFSIYLWNVGSPSSEYPQGAVNISNKVVGSAYFSKDGLNIWHKFNMTPTDPGYGPDMGYVWTDTSQSSSNPTVASRRLNARCDDGLYIVDGGGAQIHKMGVSGGLWTDLAQGYAIPL